MVKIDTDKPRLPYLEFHASEHCNLNCRGCASFCGLIKEPIFVDENQLEKDLKRIKELVWGITVFVIMGGEPLLNPNITNLFRIARDIYPDADLYVTTNGLLLPIVDRDILVEMNKYGISFNISSYKPTLELEAEIKSICDLYNVRYIFTEVKNEFGKELDIRGKVHNPQTSFDNCVAHGCTVLSKGIVTRCVYIQYAELLNKEFDTNFERGSDYIDIYNKNISGWDMLEKLYNPGEFCRYCVTKPVKFNWEVAGYNVCLEDWVVT